MSKRDGLTGTLLGIALGDALGLPAEGMSSRAISRRFGRIERFRLLGHVGFVSDDTEQSALIAQSLARYPNDVDRCVDAFRRSLLGWFARLPWGVGRATILACGRIALGFKRSGVNSAGNGAAMRAGIIGAFFHDRPSERLRFGRALAEVTHCDIRAVEGALYVAEMAAGCVAASGTTAARDTIQAQASQVVTDDRLARAIGTAVELAGGDVGTIEAARAIGTSGYVLHSTSLATFFFLRAGDTVLPALTEIISVGGDTDSNAAILGGWLGAYHGEAGLPGSLLKRIHDGPFGPSHLRGLANRLADPTRELPMYSPTGALIRNLALYPVILGHGFRRLLPF